MKHFPMMCKLLLTMLIIGVLIQAGIRLYKPPVEEVAVIMYEYKADTEILKEQGVFTITDYN